MKAMRTTLAALLVLGCAGGAAAQAVAARDEPGFGTLEASGGGMFLPGFDLGSRTATLTRSAATERFDLFSSESEVGSFPGAFARLGLYLTDRVSIEGGVRYAKPELSTRLSDDAESAEDETAVETASHYVIDGSVLYHLAGMSFAGGRGVPFISGGGGYLRELHEKNELIETGIEFHATAGLKYWLGTGGRRFGLRVEAGLSSREDGFDAEGERRILPIVMGGVSFMF